MEGDISGVNEPQMGLPGADKGLIDAGATGPPRGWNGHIARTQGHSASFF